MAFITIPSSAIEAGDAVTQDLWGLTKYNFDDHESRLTAVEGGSAVAYMPLFWNVNGFYPATFENTGIVRLPFNITVNAARLLVYTAGSGGGTEIDFLYKRGAGAWTSIFATLPSVLAVSGDYAISTNQVLSTTSLLVGDLLRMDITARQSGAPKGLVGIIEFEKT